MMNKDEMQQNLKEDYNFFIVNFSGQKFYKGADINRNS